MSQTMLAKNAVSAKLAECYVTIDGIRYNFMSAINMNAKFEKTKVTVPILGRVNGGTKSVSARITGSAEFHMNTSIWQQIAYRFQETGEDLYFDMQVTNYDPTASDIGRQTIILCDCNLDGVDLAKFDADSDDILTQSTDFTAERFEVAEAYTLMPGVI